MWHMTCPHTGNIHMPVPVSHMARPWHDVTWHSDIWHIRNMQAPTWHMVRHMTIWSQKASHSYAWFVILLWKKDTVSQTKISKRETLCPVGLLVCSNILDMSIFCFLMVVAKWSPSGCQVVTKWMPSGHQVVALGDNPFFTWMNIFFEWIILNFLNE